MTSPISITILANGFTLIPLIIQSLREKHYTRRDTSVWNGLLLVINGIFLMLSKFPDVNKMFYDLVPQLKSLEWSIEPGITTIIGVGLILLGIFIIWGTSTRKIDAFKSRWTLIIIIIVIFLQYIPLLE